VFPVKYDLDSYIPEDGILHSHRRENLKSYIALTGCSLYQRRNVFPVKYDLGSYISEDVILHSHSRENLKSYLMFWICNNHYLSSFVCLQTSLFLFPLVTGTIEQKASTYAFVKPARSM
jgi:hypothetical protein